MENLPQSYQEYLEVFKENMKIAIDSMEDQESKQILEQIDPLSEDEWQDAMDTGAFEETIDEESIKKLYEEISKLYPEDENNEQHR